MSKELKTGISGEKTFRVTYEQTAIAKGSGTVEVFSTPNLILEMEEVCLIMVRDYLDEGFSTVGTKVNVSHLAATPVGMSITVKGTLKEIDRKRLVFDVEAYDEVEKIGEGTHERFIVDIKKFTDKANDKIK